MTSTATIGGPVCPRTDPGDACSTRTGIEIPSHLAAELACLESEPNPEFRAESLFALARRAENRDETALAATIYASLASSKSSMHAQAERRLAAIQGQGSFGERAESFLRRMVRDVTHPALFLGMAVGGTVFRSGRFFAMGLLSHSGLGPSAVRILGSTVGFALEAPAFVLTNRAVSPEAASPIGKELASSYLFLGALRLGGAFADRIQRASSIGQSLALSHAGTLGGILLGHRAEEALGLRPRCDFASLLGEGLATLLHFHVSGKIFHRLGGAEFGRWEGRMDFHARDFRNSRQRPTLSLKLPEFLTGMALASPAGRISNFPGRVPEETPSAISQMSTGSPPLAPSFRIKAWDSQTGNYESLARLKAQIYPDAPVTAEEIRFDDRFRYSEHLWGRWVVEEDGQILAQAQFFQPPRMYHPRKFELNVEVHPDYRNRGLGGRLLSEMIAHLEGHSPLSLRLNVRADQKEAIRFLENRGFVGDVREWKSTLELRSFDRGPYAGLEGKLRERGILIRSLRDLQSDPDRDRKIFDMESEIIDEVPFPEPQVRLDFDYFVRTVLRNPNLLHDGYFVAVKDGDYLGTSNLLLRPGQADRGLLATRFTGVKSPYRRSGLATALKIRTIEYAQDGGFSSLVTSNSSLNDGMVSLNQRLGTKRGLDWISFVKRPHSL